MVILNSGHWGSLPNEPTLDQLNLTLSGWSADAQTFCFETGSYYGALAGLELTL